MVTMAGKRILLEAFRAEGVEFMFGNPGTSEAPMMDIMKDYPDIRYVLALQEATAVGMADGYWQARRKVPLVSLHIDNGLVNGFSLMIDQKYTYAPMVLTAGNKDIRKLVAGRSDLAEMARPFAKWSAEITHAEQMSGAIRRAFQEANSPPRGPAFLAVAANAFDDEADVSIRASNPVLPAMPDQIAIEQAARMLAEARRPIMVVGGHVGEYGGESDLQAAATLAERVGLRTYTHYSGRANFPAAHPLWHGRIQMRSPSDFEVIEAADVILAVGCPIFEDFFHITTNVLRKEQRLIHIDVAAGEIGKSERADIGIIAHPGTTLAILEQAFKGTATGTEQEAAQERRREAEGEGMNMAQQFAAKVQHERDHKVMTPAVMAAAIASALPENGAVYNDAISASPEVFHAVSPNTNADFFASRGQSIGWGIGATIGVKLALPDRPVVGVIGDGSAMMTIQGLWTAVNEGAGAVFVIVNNNSYRILKINMNHYRRITGQDLPSEYFGMDFATPLDFAAQAKAYGARGETANNYDELRSAIRDGLASGAPTVIDARVSKNL